MPNILQMQEILKSVPDQRLMQEMQQPTGRAPQFLVMTELQRRQKVRDEYQGRVQEEQTTVAEDMVRSAAPQQVPMPSGVSPTTTHAVPGWPSANGNGTRAFPHKSRRRGCFVYAGGVNGGC